MRKTDSTAAALVLSCATIAAFASPSPVAHYTFDEPSGEVARDASGNGLDAALVDCVREQFGLAGGAIRLDGEKSHVALPRAPQLDKGGDFTYSLWFKAERTRAPLALFARGGYIRGFSCQIAHSYAQFTSTPAGGGVVYRSIPMGAGQLDPWRHFAVVVGKEEGAAAPFLRMYLDGKRFAKKGGGEFWMKGEVPLKCALTIGRMTSAESRWFNGLIDEAKVYDVALSDGEIAAEFKAGRERKATGVAVDGTKVRKIDFPPLRRRHVAVYSPPGEKWMPKPDPAPQWYADRARELGCLADVIDDAALCDDKVLSTAKYDTLVLPSSAIPVDAEISIWRFLESGGCMLLQTAMPSVFKRLPDGGYDEIRGAKLFNHSRGWHAPFLVRDNPSTEGRRNMVDPLALSPEAVSIVGDLLPGKIDARPKLRYHLLDRWEQGPIDGHYGDPSNCALAGDVQFELFTDPSGIGCGFTAYRYRNARLFGATFVQLGSVGSMLVRGADGAKVFEGCLRLLEAERLPGEQTPEWHERAVKAHKAWSAYVMAFTESVRTSLDAAALLYTLGRSPEGMQGHVAKVNARFNELQALRRSQRSLLRGRRDFDAEDAAAKELLDGIHAALAELRAAEADARAALADARTPSKMPVRHKYGTIPSIASLSLPMTGARLLAGYVDTMREIGSDVLSAGVPKWFLQDPRVQARLAGLKRDHKFVGPSARRQTAGGRFNPAKGTVKDEPLVEYQFSATTNRVAAALREWAWLGDENQFRIGHADETGLGFNFWGSEPARRFRESLKAKYGDVAAFNAVCGTGYASFDEVALPLKAPTTPAEHALWEHWRKFREARLEWFYGTFRGIVKSIAPKLDVFGLPSTGAAASPAYGVDFYQLTKQQDVSGIDGTCCSDDREWLYADLSTKRYLTSEWGQLYRESTPQKIQSKLWQEMIAGALGCEQHVWSWGDDAVNYADNLDYPTINGAALRSFLRDARRYDAILLDGRRADPEVGILFSQTAREHDQSWGWAGERPFSPHMYCVNAYYAMFLQWGHSARVVDEGMLLDGTAPAVKALFVPQAAYLSEKVQRLLLDYAKKGGGLVLEGRVGRYTEMGAKSDLIFREADILPFRSEKPRTVKFGAGTVTFLGADAALGRLTNFRQFTEGVLRGLGVTERFASSVNHLMMREWVHGADTYLFVNSKSSGGASGWGIEQAELAVRGRVGVEDYIFGVPVKTEFRNGYTTFRTLVHSGCRVYRLTAAPAPAGYAEAMTRQPKYSAGDAAAASDFKEVSLPYAGRIYDVSPLKADDCTFTLATIATGSDSKLGETYLTVERGGESVRKRLFVNEPRFFRLRGRTLKVTSSNNFCMFPFHAAVRIEDAQSAPPPTKAEVKTGRDGVLTFANGLLSFDVDSAKGGALTSLKMDAERFEQIVGEKAFALTGGMPGPFRGQKLEVAKDGKDAAATLTLTSPVGEKTFREEVSIADGAAEATFRLKMGNASKMTRGMSLKWHPEMVVGAAADTMDQIDVPQPTDFSRVRFRGLGSGAKCTPGSNWAAITDSKERLSCVCSFVPEQVETVYVWQSADMYTLELFGRSSKVKQGGAVDLDFEYRFFRGLGGVDAASGRLAAHLAAPAVWDQRRRLALRIEAATADAKSRRVSMSARLLGADGHPAANLSLTADEDFSFEVPAFGELSGDVSALPDGEYTVAVEVKSGDESVSFKRKFRFVGVDKAAKELEISRLEEELRRDEGKFSKAELFSRRIDLQERRQALE